MERLKILLPALLLLIGVLSVSFNNPSDDNQEMNRLKAGFLNPPDSACPGVYWYFMDGNM